MAVIRIYQGLPASGKTTLAKKWVSEDPVNRVRFNRDDIRNMLGKYWVPEREHIIDNIYDSFMEEAMLSGYDIAIDNMNLNDDTLKEIEKLVEEFNKWIGGSILDIYYTIEYVSLLDVPLDILIERDSKRDNPIGKETIENLYIKYKHKLLV